MIFNVGIYTQVNVIRENVPTSPKKKRLKANKNSQQTATSQCKYPFHIFHTLTFIITIIIVIRQQVNRQQEQNGKWNTFFFSLLSQFSLSAFSRLCRRTHTAHSLLHWPKKEWKKNHCERISFGISLSHSFVVDCSRREARVRENIHTEVLYK